MYQTKWKDAKREAHYLNRKFFRVPKSNLQIRLRPLVSEWGITTETNKKKRYIILNEDFPSYSLFRSVLAHEMIHLWQFVNNHEGTHDNRFFSWRRVLGKEGYNILESY